jgi:hypothetical protein
VLVGVPRERTAAAAATAAYWLTAGNFGIAQVFEPATAPAGKRA